MEYRETINEIFEILDAEYEKEIVFLEYNSPFELLIGVVLSARTTDRQVNIVIKQLFAQFPTPDDLANSNYDEVCNIIRSVGFFKVKARNIIDLSKMLVSEFGSTVPDTMEDLLRLPGCGRKSANVILGTCYGKPAIIVDTHFGRVCRRLGLTDSDDPKKVEFEIKELLDKPKQYRFSMVGNLHGRVVCYPRKPDCQRCKLAGLCRFFAEEN
ncbi:MAG: endonuclease III [Spirochaetales bacterium]|nr:endonuclease III [Spirochaetales bacterium]